MKILTPMFALSVAPSWGSSQLDTRSFIDGKLCQVNRIAQKSPMFMRVIDAVLQNKESAFGKMCQPQWGRQAMTLNEARKLKVGDRVVWPEDVNGCPMAVGVVKFDLKYNANYVEWPDSDAKTYLHDAAAVKCLELGT